MQAERYKAQQVAILTLVKALEAIPGIRQTVPDLRPWLERTVMSDAHSAVYDALPPLPTEQEISKMAAR
jgi:hypothetical protein